MSGLSSFESSYTNMDHDFMADFVTCDSCFVNLVKVLDDPYGTAMIALCNDCNNGYGEVYGPITSPDMDDDLLPPYSGKAEGLCECDSTQKCESCTPQQPTCTCSEQECNACLKAEAAYWESCTPQQADLPICDCNGCEQCNPDLINISGDPLDFLPSRPI